MAFKVVLSMHKKYNRDFLLIISYFIIGLCKENRIVDEKKKLERLSIIYKTTALMATF